MTKVKLSADEKFENQDFDLFEAITAIDKKDYGYYDRLTEEQQKKFVPFMLLHWISAVKGSHDLQSYYLQSTNYHANTYMFNEAIQRNPKLQWLMLCAASPGLGKQYHQWIPNISPSVSKLKTQAKTKDVKEYFKKIYPSTPDSDLQLISEAFVIEQKKKMYLAEKFPNLKISDIEILSGLVTDDEIKEYEKEFGNY